MRRIQRLKLLRRECQCECDGILFYMRRRTRFGSLENTRGLAGCLRGPCPTNALPADAPGAASCGPQARVSVVLAAPFRKHLEQISIRIAEEQRAVSKGLVCGR